MARSSPPRPMLVAAFVALAVAACDRDPPTEPTSKRIAPAPNAANPYFGWDPGFNCHIGKRGGTWFGYLFPVSDTACGVTWTANTPQFGLNPLVEWGMYFPYGPDTLAGTDLVTAWWIGSYNDIAKDKLTFTFDFPIIGFAMDLQALDMAGHYMIAYNGLGVQIGRADFVPDPTDRRDSQRILADGIMKVEYYFPLGNCDQYSCDQLDPTMHQAAFERAPFDLRMTCTPSGALVRGDTVSCVTRSSNQAGFTLKRVKATTTDGRVIFDAPANLFTYAYTLRGPAVLSTNLEVTATEGSATYTATGSFTVNSRVGRRAKWMHPSFSDAGFPAVPPRFFWDKGYPLASPYPGFRTTATGFSWDTAGPATTIIEGTGASWEQVGSGPNAGVSFARDILRPTRNRVAPGLYFTKALDTANAFYKKQTGPAPYCTAAQMDILYDQMATHELGHWNQDRAILLPFKATTVVDSLIGLPGTGGLSAVRAKFTSFVAEMGDSLRLSNQRVHTDSTYNPNPPACIMRPL